ncbi:MAG: hypothetical protein ACRDPJ_18485 [Nocardioidaceae bacterium]
MTTPSNRPLLAEPGIRFGSANAAVILSLQACAVLGVRAAQTLVVLASVVVLVSIATPVGVGGMVGATSWAFYTGFVENSYGSLTFHHTDLTRLMVLVGAGAVAACVVRRRRPSPHPVNSGGSPWQTWSSSR